MWIIQLLFDIIFPPKCIVCKRKSHTLCDSCIRALHRSVDTPYPWIYSRYSYRDQNVSRILRAFKYYHRHTVGKRLVSSLMESEFLTFIKRNANVLFVPIPMYYVRALTRGGNHAEVLASLLSKETGIPYTKDLLLRKKATPQQAKAMTRTDREKSIRGAFMVHATKNKEYSPQTIIILVDDIVTTGATLKEAKKTLEHAGYKNVIAVTLAH